MSNLEDLAHYRITRDKALEARANWEAVAVLLNEDLKRALGPVRYAKAYGDSGLTFMWEKVTSEQAKS